MGNQIDSIRKRKALQPRARPYTHKIKPKYYIGYRRNKAFDAGKWIALIGKQQHPLGIEADMTYTDALDAALLWFASCEGIEGSVVNATVETAIDDYVQHLRIERSGQAAKETADRLRNHVSPVMLKTRLASLTTRQIKVFRDGLVKVGDDPEATRKSKDTANRVMGMLKAALNLAYKTGMVASDVAWRRVDLFKNVSKPRTLFLTDDQVAALLDASKGGFHSLVEVAIHTGARYGELVNARVGAFDSVDGTLQLTGKTGPRVVYLSDRAVEVIQRVVRDRLPSAFLLVRDDGEQWARGHQQDPVKKVVRAAGLPTEMVFYSLRHYHISKALLAGVNAQVVAENCGTSIIMIEKHYGKFMKSDRRAMFDLVELGA